MPDLSDNCQMCGANPHEECRMKGPDHLAINCPDNLAAQDSRMDDMREHTMVEHLDEGHPTQFIIHRSEELKRKSCCCGATASKPCACMKKGVMKCSAKEPKCPCYKAKDIKKAFDAGWSVVKEGRFHGEDEEGNPYDRFAEMAWADNPMNRPFILDCKACTDIDEETGIRRFVNLCPAHYMQYKANEAAKADHDNTPPDDFYYQP